MTSGAFGALIACRTFGCTCYLPRYLGCIFPFLLASTYSLIILIFVHRHRHGRRVVVVFMIKRERERERAIERAHSSTDFKPIILSVVLFPNREIKSNQAVPRQRNSTKKYSKSTVHPTLSDNRTLIKQKFPPKEHPQLLPSQIQNRYSV